jgi:hypothetical protein
MEGMAGCSDDPFNALVNSFTEQISMLKHLCMMRSTGTLAIQGESVSSC